MQPWDMPAYQSTCTLTYAPAAIGLKLLPATSKYTAAAESMREEYIIIYSERVRCRVCVCLGEYDVRESMCVYVWDEKGSRIDYYRQLWWKKKSSFV